MMNNVKPDGEKKGKSAEEGRREGERGGRGGGGGGGVRNFGSKRKKCTNFTKQSPALAISIFR